MMKKFSKDSKQPFNGVKRHVFMKYTPGILLLSFLVLFQHCKKESDNFSYCTACPISSWVGSYSGTGTYFTVSSGESFSGIEVIVNIDNPYDTKIVVQIEAENYVSESFSTFKNDENHYILFGAGSKTLDIGLKKKGDEYRIDGTLKKNTWNKVDSVWIVNQSLTFSAQKK